jgi:peroxiredoxin
LIEQSAQLNTLEGLSKKYFWKQPVLYDNTGYMEFFNEFFNGYIPAESKHITREDLDRTINSERSFPAFLDSLGKDSLLRNEVLRELVALKTLGEVYYSQQYDKSAILEMLKYVEEKSKFPQHKQIAENYLKLFTKLAQGTVAPDFKLKDYTGQLYSLAEFNKDKYIYLFFWTTWCVPCINEMNLMNKLKEKYGTKVEFVGISTDKEFMTYYYFMQKNKKFNFTTLHWGNNTSLLENYDVKAYPTFILIGPDGKIVQYPAENPSGSLDGLLYDLTKTKK